MADRGGAAMAAHSYMTFIASDTGPFGAGYKEFPHELLITLGAESPEASIPRRRAQ